MVKTAGFIEDLTVGFRAQGCAGQLQRAILDERWLVLFVSGMLRTGGHFASGFGRSWNFITLLVVPLPPSM